MTHTVSLDVHKRETQVCVADADGNIVVEKRIRTSLNSYKRGLGKYTGAPLIMEPVGFYRPVAQWLREVGFEVHMVHVGRLPKDRRKSDKRDAKSQISAEAAAAVFQVSSSEGQRSAVLGGTVACNGAEAISVAYGAKVNGTLPEAAQVAGSAIWVRGNLSVALNALAADKQIDERESPAYAAVVRGKATSFSYGGRPATSFPAVATGAAITVMALLLALGYAFRDVVSHGAAKFFGPLYSKLHQSRILDHSTRATVYEALRANPGLSFYGLKKIGGFAAGTLAHHLKHLERFGLVGSRRMGRFRRYYPTRDPQVAKAMSQLLLENPLAQTIAGVVARRPGIGQSAILAELVGEHPVTLNGLKYHLLKLEREKLVSIQREGRRRVYWPTPALRELRPV